MSKETISDPQVRGEESSSIRKPVPRDPNKVIKPKSK